MFIWDNAQSDGFLFRVAFYFNFPGMAALTY